MSGFKFNTSEGKFSVNQGIKDIMIGMEKNDLSRVTVASGKNMGVHVGNNSQTVGRQNKPFGSK